MEPIRVNRETDAVILLGQAPVGYLTEVQLVSHDSGRPILRGRPVVAANVLMDEPARVHARRMQEDAAVIFLLVNFLPLTPFTVVLS